MTNYKNPKVLFLNMLLKISTRTILSLGLLLSTAGTIKANDENQEWSIQDFFGKSTFDKIEIHGFLSQGFLLTQKNNYLGNDTQNGSFEFNELGIHFSTTLTDKIRVGLQLASRDRGDLGNNEIKIDWAFLDYQYNDQLGFRFGKVKMPLGLFYETWDIDSLRTPILLPPSCYASNNRESFIGMNGFGLYGSFDLDQFGCLDYEFAYGVGTVEPDGGFAKTMEAGSNNLLDMTNVDVKFTSGGKLGWHTPIDGLYFAGSYLATESDCSGIASRDSGYLGLTKGDALDYQLRDTFKLVLSGKYEWNDWTFLGEFNRITGNSTMIVGGNPVLSFENHIEGYYLGVSYPLLEWCEIGSYYSRVNTPWGSRGPANINDDIALTAKFQVNEHLCFKLEYHNMRGTAIISGRHNSGTPERRWSLFAAKVSITF